MASGVLVDVEVFVNATYGYDIRGEIVGERGTVALAEADGAVLKREGRRSGRVPADWRERFSRAYDVGAAGLAEGGGRRVLDWAQLLGRLRGHGRGGKLPGGAADRQPHGAVSCPSAPASTRRTQ